MPHPSPSARCDDSARCDATTPWKRLLWGSQAGRTPLWGTLLWGIGVAAGLLAAPSPTAASPKAASHKAAGGGGTAYGDPKLGYALERPAGWTVRADAHSILVQSPDRAQAALIETFDAPEGASASDRIQRPTDKETALFPDATLNLSPSPDAAQEAAGSLAFTGPAGPGRARLLCRIQGGKGLFFAIAAPADRFDEAQPALMHVVRSLRFLTPSGGGHAAHAPDIGAIKRGLHFVTWTDPKEHAFHLQVPEGWKMEGGAFRLGVTDVRMAYQATSPGGDIAIVFGDQGLPPFEVPNPISAQLGEQELQIINESPTFHPALLHYMTAPEFNRWYLEKAAAHLIDGLQITGDRETPETPPGVSIALTEFTGRSTRTGKKLHGLINTMTSRGGGGEGPTWSAIPEMVICDDDAALSARFTRALVAYLQMKFTYAENGAWVARRRKEIFDATGQQLAMTAQISHQTAIDSDAKENAIMGAFRAGSDAPGAPPSGFAAYIGDREGVTGADGTRTEVASGHKYHYQDSTGAILSTDSAYAPGVDWTLMTEH